MRHARSAQPHHNTIGVCFEELSSILRLHSTILVFASFCPPRIPSPQSGFYRVGVAQSNMRGRLVYSKEPASVCLLFFCTGFRIVTFRKRRRAQAWPDLPVRIVCRGAAAGAAPTNPFLCLLHRVFPRSPHVYRLTGSRGRFSLWLTVGQTSHHLFNLIIDSDRRGRDADGLHHYDSCPMLAFGPSNPNTVRDGWAQCSKVVWPAPFNTC